ncbi:MAG: PD-(D/E)XK nuclease family protein [Nanoarchaeota archaeon]|nr:PD-(D/E)XK nuclease family protein [Nanoarchaeota archaeon]
MTYKLSPSSLNLMEECPRCFWLQVVKNKKRPAGIFPSLPSGMDGILKTHFDRFMEKGKMPPELKIKECEGCNLFDDKELLKIWRSNFKGISFTDKEGNVLHGAVDNILVKGKKLVVLDYKTRGFPLKEDTAEHYRNQLDVYNFLLRKMGYETEDFAFLLFYVPKEVMETGEVIFNTQIVKMKVDVDAAEKLWMKALKLLNGKCPVRHAEDDPEKCEWCKLLGEE